MVWPHKERPPAAKARAILALRPARLKPCPFKTVVPDGSFHPCHRPGELPGFVDDSIALEAEVDGAVGGGDARFDDVAGVQILGSAGLNLQEHLPFQTLGEQRYDA